MIAEESVSSVGCKLHIQDTGTLVMGFQVQWWSYFEKSIWNHFLQNTAVLLIANRTLLTGH